jgi:hypothetical protein
VLSLIHTLCSSLQHVQSLPSLLYIHWLPSANGFQHCSFHVRVLTGRQLYLNSLIAPALLVITSWHGPHRKHHVSNSNPIVRAYSLLRKRVYWAVAQKQLLFTESPLSNGSVHHNKNNTWCIWKPFSTLSHYSLKWLEKNHIGLSLNSKKCYEVEYMHL